MGDDKTPRPAGVHDWRLVPLAVGAWVGAAAGTSGVWWPVWICLAGLALGFVAARRWPWLVVGLVGCAVLAVMSGLVAEQRASSKLAALADERAIVRAEVRLVAEPRPRPPKPPMPPSATAYVEVNWVEGRGERSIQRLPALATGSGERAAELQALQLGGTYVVEARLAATDPDDGATAVLRLREIEAQTTPPGPLERIAAGMRQGLRDAVANSPPAQRALVPSLVVGDTSKVDDAMADEFRDTGLTHLMAVSGANLALMLGVVLALLRVVGVRGWAVRIVAVGGVGMFVLICGPEPSVQRAAVMGMVALAATGVGRGRRSIRGLAVAVIVLMALDPWLSRAPGFWLSVAACLGIVTLGSRFIEALTTWAPRWLAEAWSIPLAAQLLTQPIVTALSGEVSLVGVITNVLAGPFVGPTTVLGFAAACLSPLPTLSGAAGWAAGWSSQPILWLASWGAGLPMATITWQEGTLGVLLITVLALGLIPLVEPILRRAWASLLALAILVAVTVIRLPTPGWPGEWQVAFCDVGQGDATVLRAGPDVAVLVDTGPEPQPVLDCLADLGIRHVPLIVLTHFHADHIGGHAGVVARHPPSLVLTSRLLTPKTAAAEVQRASGEATVRAAVPGERLTVGDVTWRTVSAWEPRTRTAAPDAGESATENDASVVGIAEVAGLRVMLAGDAEPAGQREALRVARGRGASLRAEVLKLPHHGSSRQDAEFFSATGAVVAVASAGEGNDYGHPAPSALALAEQHGMAIARTDVEGTITVTLDDQVAVRRRGK